MNGWFTISGETSGRPSSPVAMPASARTTCTDSRVRKLEPSFVKMGAYRMKDGTQTFDEKAKMVYPKIDRVDHVHEEFPPAGRRLLRAEKMGEPHRCAALNRRWLDHGAQIGDRSIVPRAGAGHFVGDD